MDMTAYQQGMFFTTQSASTSQQDSPDLNLTPRLLLLCARHKKKADRGVRFKSGLSARVFFIQSRRIDHKHGKMLSDHRDAGLEQIWPRMADENLPTNLLIFCYLAVVAKNVGHVGHCRRQDPNVRWVLCKHQTICPTA